MEKDQLFFVGVDISKATFDVYFQDTEGKKYHLKLSNDEKGFQSLLSSLPKEKRIKVVMEASGPYFYQLASFLYENHIEVAVINPLVIRRYCQMKLIRTKTDKADAMAIFGYARQEEDLPCWKPQKETYLKIRQFYSSQRLLMKNLHAIARQLESFQATGTVDEWIQEQMEKSISNLERQIKEIEDKLQELIKQEHKALKEQLESIPGIGKKASLLLIVCLKGFEGFVSHRQVISYLGLSPRSFQSGTSVKGKAKICKMGMGQVRACLYMAARAAKKYNLACKQLYERLIAKGKAHKQAMVAVINKLLKQAFALVQSGEIYNPEYALATAKTK